LTRQNERCHENASDCLRLDRCGGDAGDASTCRLLTRLPSRRTMPGVLRSVPAILRSAAAILWSIALLCSAPAILWSIALLCSAPAILRLRLGQPNSRSRMPAKCKRSWHRAWSRSPASFQSPAIPLPTSNGSRDWVCSSMQRTASAIVSSQRMRAPRHERGGTNKGVLGLN
jgi:hypothetical protein